MQNVDRAPNWAYKSALYAAQDKESKESLMQEMWCREGNIGTHSMRMPRVEKDKNTDLGFAKTFGKKTGLIFSTFFQTSIYTTFSNQTFARTVCTFFPHLNTLLVH